MTKLTDKELGYLVLGAETYLSSPGKYGNTRHYHWTHKRTGNTYVVHGIVLAPIADGDPAPQVRYSAQPVRKGMKSKLKPLPNNKKTVEWVRPLDEFLDKFEPTFV